MTIVRNGTFFKLSADEVESAYREQEHIYQLADAQNHMIAYLEELDNCSVTEISRELLEKIVKRYEHSFDCNVPENDTWECAIKAVLDDETQKQENSLL